MVGYCVFNYYSDVPVLICSNARQPFESPSHVLMFQSWSEAVFFTELLILGFGGTL